MTSYVLGICAAIIWAGSNTAKSDKAAGVDVFISVVLSIAAVIVGVTNG